MWIGSPGSSKRREELKAFVRQREDRGRGGEGGAGRGGVWGGGEGEVREGAGENEGGIPQFPFDFDETNRLWANLKCAFERGEGGRKSPVVDRGPSKPDLSFSQEVKSLFHGPPAFEAKVRLSAQFSNLMDEGPCLI